MSLNDSARSAPQPRAYSPFDDSAKERQRRMGLLMEDGSPNREVISALCRVFAGQFFDDLCDASQDMETARGTVERLSAEAERADPKRRFLLICLQYDAIYRSLPDPVWWLSGNLLLADAFSAGFVSCLRELLEGGEQDEKCEGLSAAR